MAYIDKYGVKFSIDRKTLIKCPGSIDGAYVIPNGVTKINKDAFDSCHQLVSIVIPDSVTEIGEGNFCDCEKLRSIVIGNGIKHIDNCFKYCNSLSSIVCAGDLRISQEWNYLQETKWFSLQPIGAITLGATLIAYIPSDDETLDHYKLPDNILYIATDAFEYCDGLESIDFNNAQIVDCELPDSISTILASGDALQETESFDNTLWFKEQKDGCVYIGSLLYKFKTTLVTYPSIIHLKEKTQVINKKAFYGIWSLQDKQDFFIIEDENDKNRLIPFVILCNNNLSIIGESAFEESAISEIILSKSVIKIQNRAFCNSWLLSTINLPDDLQEIGEEAFEGCLLTNIHIPSSITNIPKRAFYRNRSLVSVSFSPFIPGVELIEEGAFAECDIRSIHIPESVRVISYGAFCNNSSLTNIHLSEGIEVIENRAFASDQALESFHYLEIPSTIKSLGDAFARYRHEEYYDERYSSYRCDENAVEMLVIGCDINNYRWASRFGTELKTVIFKEGVTVIPSYCFMECAVLKNVILPNSLLTIKEGVFQGCESLETLTLPHNIKEIWSSSLPQNIKKVIVLSGQLLLKIGAYGEARYNYYIENNVFVDANGNSITPELMIYKLGNRNDNGLHCYKGDLYDIEVVEVFKDFKPKDDSDVYDNSDKPSYSQYGGYNGYDDDTINSAFEGDPEATWNID